MEIFSAKEHINELFEVASGGVRLFVGMRHDGQCGRLLHSLLDRR